MTTLCTFQLAGQHFGIPVDEVQEVLRPQPTTRVPLAPAGVTGLVNLRGQILATFDLRTRLGWPAADSVPLTVVVRTADGPKAVLVDDIGDVITADAADFEPTADLLHGPARELIRGVFKLDGHLLLVLDVAKAVTVASGPA